MFDTSSLLTGSPEHSPIGTERMERVVQGTTPLPIGNSLVEYDIQFGDWLDIVSLACSLDPELCMLKTYAMVTTPLSDLPVVFPSRADAMGYASHYCKAVRPSRDNAAIVTWDGRGSESPAEVAVYSQ